MKMSASSDIYLFADFRLDRAGGGLFRRNGSGAFAPVTIGSRALDLLAVLIERRGDVVSKEEIAAAVWPKMAVEEGNLFVQISALRAILDKGRSGQSSIQTVAGRGYRFITPAKVFAIDQSSKPDEAVEREGTKAAQTIRYCHAPDGVRLAYAISGSGPVLVKSGNWLNHLEYDWQSPIWGHVFRGLSRAHTLIRYDARGNGMSDWDVDELSLDAWVTDLETVVDAVGIERFPLLGISQGGPVAIAYAVRHPERVSHIILYGAFALGGKKRAPAEKEMRDAMTTLMRIGWGADNPSFRQMFTSRFIPGGTQEQADFFNDLQLKTTSPECAARYFDVVGDFDVTDLLPKVKAPALVMHVRDDAMCPFDAGRQLAAGIPGAHFVGFPGRNHLFLEHEPACDRFFQEISLFLRGRAKPPHLSIVVLPFANLGGDPEQEYFADGVTDCLTTDLSRISGAFVIGRSTAFTYKGKAADVRQIGRELNVRYVLEGSVQRGGKCLRVNVQLLDTETASHIWAERFDKPIADLFDMQDEIVSQLANALGQELAGAEAVRAGRATNPDSMDHYFVGQAMARKGHTVAILDEARLQYDRALELDPDNVDALVARAWIDLAFVGSWLCDDGDDRRLSAEACVDKALKLRPGSATAHCALGALRMYGKRAAQGIAECGRALAIDRNFAAAHGYIGMAKIFAGRNEETEAHILEALRISPRDSNAWAWMLYGGMAKFRLGRDEEALAWLNRSVEFNPNSPATRFCLAATLAHLDRVEEAREAAGACLEINPSFTIARFRSQTFSDHPVYLAGRERMYEGLRRAGMPEG
jgi:TolB-like protein/pimeloyl-ACP methyl ester carboxylesterase/DNA-binding winged helix-turn-helix (wHTH) protein